MSKNSNDKESSKDIKQAWAETEEQVNVERKNNQKEDYSSPIYEIKPGETGKYAKESKTNFTTKLDPEFGNLDDLDDLAPLDPDANNQGVFGVTNKTAKEDSEFYVPPVHRSIKDDKEQKPNSEAANAKSSIFSSISSNKGRK
jgi:hypothetical protein